MRGLNLCRAYKAVAVDCRSSLGAVAMMSATCTRSTTRSDESVSAVIHDDDDLSWEHAWAKRKGLELELEL